MAGLSRDREVDVPEWSGWEFPGIFTGIFWFPGNGIRECRPLAFSYFEMLHNIPSLTDSGSYNGPYGLNG